MDLTGSFLPSDPDEATKTIQEKNRTNLDNCIDEMILCIKTNAAKQVNKHIVDTPLSNEEFLSIVGDINYTFSRILGKFMGSISYSKIAMITGVLENIKQDIWLEINEHQTAYEKVKIINKI